MRKYYVSHVDLSEIEAISVDKTSLEISIEKLTEAGAINAKGKPDINIINNLSGSLSFPFFGKLSRRLSRRRGGIRTFYETVQKLQSAKEFNALYLYIVIHYGFIEWQVPALVTCMPAVPDVLKAYINEFMADFEEFINEQDAKEAESSDNDDDSE